MGRTSLKSGFREAARFQAFCAACGKGGRFQAHHVVSQQELKRRDKPLHDWRNALRLCPVCHEHHTNASQRIKVSELLDENIDYAFESLGEYAFDYLNRYYEPDSPDALKIRLESHND